MPSFAEPSAPAGNSKFSAWCRQLVIALRAARVLPGRGYKVKYTSSGTILEIDADSTGGHGTLVYKGTYGSGTTYKVGDVVRVRSGTSQGIYVCVKAGTGHDPIYPEPADTGGTNYWEILALGIKQINVCSAGTDTTVYANTSATF